MGSGGLGEVSSLAGETEGGRKSLRRCRQRIGSEHSGFILHKTRSAVGLPHLIHFEIMLLDEPLDFSDFYICQHALFCTSVLPSPLTKNLADPPSDNLESLA